MSNDYVLITDSTTDLPPDIAEKLGLTIVPYIFILDGQEYFNHLDHRTLPIKDFYGLLHSGKSASTSLVTEQRYIDTFEPFLQEGKDIIYMCLSSGLSSSYSQSLLAADTLREKYPERKLAMIDSLSASLGQGMLAWYAFKAREQGKGFDEAAAYLETLAKKIVMWIRADDLQHLRRGGRVSGAAAFMGTMLSIKPMIHVNDEGRLVPVAKMRGKGKSLEFLTDQLAAVQVDEAPHQAVFISHADALDEAEELKKMVLERFGERDIIINDIGPVIGAHTGPGTIIMTFVGKTREMANGK
jgi:DegV family protein with EDD domain